jgi:hypothetical protein
MGRTPTILVKIQVIVMRLVIASQSIPILDAFLPPDRFANKLKVDQDDK